MKHVIKTLLLLTPMTTWAAGLTPVPEPEVLPLLGIGIVAAIALKFFKKK